MCGRYALSVAMIDFEEDFGVEEMPDVEIEDRYNIAPTQPMLIVRENRHSGTGKRELAHVTWGLIPPWADSPGIGSKMINARAETAAEKPAFRHALRRRRCLVPTSGFYEWCKNAEVVAPATEGAGRAPGGILRGTAGKRVTTEDMFGGGIGDGALSGHEERGNRIARAVAPARVPYYISMKDGRPFGFGGIWETWCGPNGEVIESCAILTTSANELLQPLHDRMPVIIAQKQYDLWLDPDNEDAKSISPLLAPFAAERMKTVRVSTRVNSVRNDGVELVAPV